MEIRDRIFILVFWGAEMIDTEINETLKQIE